MTASAVSSFPSELPLLSDAIPSDATCARHPTVKAAATCYRCGTFLCAQDFSILDAHVFCAACAARPDVDYLEAYRLKYWGKRDGWAWLVGIGGLINIPVSLAVVAAAVVGGRLAPTELLLEGVVLAVGINNVLFWLGRPIARSGIFVGLALLTLVNALTAGGAAAAGMLIPLLVCVAMVQSTRNKLFFKLPVARAELKKAWNLFHNNTVARSATTLGIGGLLIPPFAPMAIVCGIIGLRRVDPSAHPPIGNRGRAVAGIVLGAIGSLWWGGFGLVMLLARK